MRLLLFTPFFLIVCGPTGFNASFKNAVASFSVKKSANVTLHCEDFEY